MSSYRTVCSSSTGGCGRIARPLLGLVVLTAAALSAGCRDSSTASGSPPPPLVRVEAVVQQDVPIYREWVGSTVGYVTAQISARVSGYLVSQNYKEGKRVNAGDLMFEIDPRPYQIAAEQARAQLLQSQSQLEQAKAQVAQAEADVAKAGANQKKTELDVGRYTPLAERGSISQQELDNAVQANLANLASLQAARRPSRTPRRASSRRRRTSRRPKRSWTTPSSTTAGRRSTRRSPASRESRTPTSAT